MCILWFFFPLMDIHIVSNFWLLWILLLGAWLYLYLSTSVHFEGVFLGVEFMVNMFVLSLTFEDSPKCFPQYKLNPFNPLQPCTKVPISPHFYQLFVIFRLKYYSYPSGYEVLSRGLGLHPKWLFWASFQPFVNLFGRNV